MGDEFIFFFFFFFLFYLIDIFSSFSSEDLYSDMQRIKDCRLDCNLVEITPIRDLLGQFGACAQQYESGLLHHEKILI